MQNYGDIIKMISREGLGLVDPFKGFSHVCRLKKAVILGHLQYP